MARRGRLKEPTIGRTTRIKAKPRRSRDVFPTIDEIDEASRISLGYWLRYLPSPGTTAIGHDDFGDKLAIESAALDLIMERFESLGGWSPTVSKAVDALHETKRKKGDNDGPR